MRWLWLDRIVELIPRQRLVAIKHVSLAEEHLHDHFASELSPPGGSEPLPPMPVMPACFIVEGTAQAAGILIGHAEGFREKVILAKVSKAELDLDAVPGDTLRYTATIQQMDAVGAAASGLVEILSAHDPARPPQTLARIDLVFSHLDNNLAGESFPEENFVFGESFRTLLRTSGVA
ncbi:MAG: beta-hydroxyacyl-ACP dehydratase [Planctomycetota bacterium]|nr:beta-hydroxyacyl-ACP dehydratase [Planctomycetota bacterium]